MTLRALVMRTEDGDGGDEGDKSDSELREVRGVIMWTNKLVDDGDGHDDDGNVGHQP